MWLSHLSLLHDKYAIVSTDKAPNNIVLVCKSHYLDCLIKELGIDNSLSNPTYTTIALTKEEVLDNHRSILCSFGLIDFLVFSATFSYIMATSFSGRRSQTTIDHEQATDKLYDLQLRVECTLLQFTKPGTNPHRIGLYELLGNPTT